MRAQKREIVWYRVSNCPAKVLKILDRDEDSKHSEMVKLMLDRGSYQMVAIASPHEIEPIGERSKGAFG